MYKKYTESNAAKQGLIEFKEEDGDLFIVSRIEKESSRKKKKVNKADKGIENELIGTEIICNSILKKRKIDKMYNMVTQQPVLDEEGMISGRTDISLIDKKINKLRYAVIEFKNKNISKKSVEDDFNTQLSNYLFEDNNDYHGNFFATIVYTDADLLLENPSKITTYMNLTEEKRAELGIKTLKNYGVYIETRIADDSNEREKKIKNDQKDYVIPELVNSLKKYHEYGTYNYVKVSDSIHIPTNSPYPEQLKNIRDIITAAIGTKSSETNDSRSKRALVNEVMNTILKNATYEINKQTEKPEVYFKDENVISIYGRVKEFFCAENKTKFVSLGKMENSDVEEMSICSCSCALVDGQNSVHSMSIILLLLNMIKADFSGVLNEDMTENSTYRSFRKIFNDNDFFLKNESNEVSLKKINLLIEAISNLNIQINIQPLSPYYLNKINDIIRAKNYSIKVNGSDNKLFVYQKEIPLIQKKIMEDSDLLGLSLKYPKSITTRTDNNEDEILNYRDFEELESKSEEDSFNFNDQLSLNDLIHPHAIIKEKKKGEDVTSKLKKVFKGNMYTYKDIENFFEMVEPFEETKVYLSKKLKLEEQLKSDNNAVEKLSETINMDKKTMNNLIHQNEIKFQNELNKLADKESVVNNKLFNEFKITMIDYYNTQQFFYKHIEKVKAEISTNIVNKRLFGTFVSFAIENDIFGKTNIDLVEWGKTMESLIKSRQSWTEFVNDYIGSKDPKNYIHVMNTLAEKSILKEEWKG